jgi:hypothetical protein
MRKRRSEMGDFYRQVHRQYLEVKHVHTAERLNTADEAENKDCCEYQQQPRRAREVTKKKVDRVEGE